MQKHGFGGRVGAKIVIPGFEMPSEDPGDAGEGGDPEA
jgi:hypothetical protein